MPFKRGLAVLLGWIVLTALGYFLFATATAILIFLIYLPIVALLLSIYDQLR